MTDTLRLTDGHVLRPDMTVERADVLIDTAAGTISAIGDVEDPGDQTLDASDSLVMPGLVNAHTHVAMTLLRGYADDKPLDAWLQEDIWPAEAELTASDVRVGAELGVLEMIKGGVTAFADMYFHVPEIAAVVEEAGVRARLGHGVVTIGKDDADAHADNQESIDVAVEYDGYADGRVQTAYMPHSLTTVDETYIREYVAQARDEGIPVHYHANETRDEVTPIVDERDERPLEYADDLGMLTDDDFLAHGVHTDETEIELLADRGTSVIHCPASNMKLASGMAPVQAMLDADVTVGIGTDGAASNNDLSVFDEVRDAAMLGKLAADDASAVPAEAAIEMATAGGADAIGLPGGRLVEGAAADIAVVDFSDPHVTPVHDHVSHLAYSVTASDVRHTICDGRVLMQDRVLLTLDEPDILERARDTAAAIADRAE